MRRILEMTVVAAVVAFAVHGIGVQTVNAETRPGAAHASSDKKSKGGRRVTRAHRQASPKIAVAPTGVVPPSMEPVFLSDAWLKQEKQTDDRLRRFMNICKGC